LKGVSSRSTNKKRCSIDASADEISYDVIGISGFLSNAAKFSESYVFSKLYAKGKFKSLLAICDDIGFARKRMVNPNTVYSGLIDMLQFVEADAEQTSAMENALHGIDAWFSY
jgi:hypothetical protein